MYENEVAITPAQFLSTVPSKLYHSGHLGSTIGTQSYSLYPLSQLNVLLDDMRRHQAPPLLRYLVDEHGKLWFTKGNVGFTCPAHHQMTGEANAHARALAAGNIRLDEDYLTLIQINHKSSDFRPEVSSILWLLVITLKQIQLPFTMPNTLIIKQSNRNAGNLAKFEYSVAQLHAWAEGITDPLVLDKIANQPQEIRTVTYSAPQRRRLADASETDNPLAKRLRTLGLFRRPAPLPAMIGVENNPRIVDDKDPSVGRVV